MARSRRAAAVIVMWLVAVAAVVASETGGPKLGCFCDCMKNRCMTLGAADKFGCAVACNQACTQIGKPGQSRDDDFCGF
jgi:hypothetical protein